MICTSIFGALLALITCCARAALAYRCRRSDCRRDAYREDNMARLHALPLMA
ncbi:uncharacterized protein BO95DRAFT_440221 [Aspergillus brunneoviolaceus CBS 621.78]|uniref:Uncharacterized protein n=1 Tax=Aspergillus brunneoviolaceus CBS 621.78 TaxID=1450534 RepID=A0ACD1GGY6_9EURO|nr:hypothetical protein BO95DRAFT_440221 [Aspergillus brunneoviolaceus CBS 621.78]RAH48430.1 hypothetical protein BO95DRAFT_440221 [Aspergillus brunneoviolaceus CBS 621.78]